jgi:hypothetical protein
MLKTSSIYTKHASLSLSLSPPPPSAQKRSNKTAKKNKMMWKENDEFIKKVIELERKKRTSSVL